MALNGLRDGTFRNPSPAIGLPNAVEGDSGAVTGPYCAGPDGPRPVVHRIADRKAVIWYREDHHYQTHYFSSLAGLVSSVLRALVLPLHRFSNPGCHLGSGAPGSYRRGFLLMEDSGIILAADCALRAGGSVSPLAVTSTGGSSCFAVRLLHGLEVLLGMPLRVGR